MGILDTIAIVLSVAAVLSFINARFIRLPSSIGLMLISLVLSLALLVMGIRGFAPVSDIAIRFVGAIDFDETLMQGMLSFLLFAGALHVNLEDLAKQKWVIGSLATLGTLSSTFVVGGMFWVLSQAFSLPLSVVECLLFGALISPTDPIAVLGILKSAGAPKSLETKITGESLFNDGIGVVVFVVLLGVAASDSGEFHLAEASILFVEEALGGVVFGLVLGGLGYGMLRQLDDYVVEVLITLAIVMGGYSAALAMHTSGPIAVVVAGLLIGNQGRTLAMSEKTREHLDTFWELIDEVLNAVLFVLIGFELLVIELGGLVLLVGILAIPLVLVARFLCVSGPVLLLRMSHTFSPGVIKVLTWGGLRGGISVALALSIPAGEARDIILPVTYVVVVFSIVVQGLTVGRLIKSVVNDPSKVW